MRERLRVFIAACFYYSGLVKFTHWFIRRPERRLIILNYHRATGENLRRQLLYLRRHYRILHLETALEELYSPCNKGKELHDRRMPLVLTFDDGYRDNYPYGFALARELQIPMTIFLIPAYIESGQCFWWLEGERLVSHAQVDKVTIEGRTYSLREPEERGLLVRRIDAGLRYATAVSERETFLAAVRTALAVPSPVAENVDLRPLTWAEIREMEASGWVSFGAHTMHHPILAYLADPAEVQREVEECRTVLEQQLGHPVRTFAYPVGQPEHIGDAALRAVQDAGYDWAVTTIHGSNSSQSDPYQLRRIAGEVSRHWLVMAAEVSGVWKFFSPLWKNLRGSEMIR